MPQTKRFSFSNPAFMENANRSIESTLKLLRDTNWTGVCHLRRVGPTHVQPERVGNITQFGIVQEEGVRLLYIDVEIVAGHERQFEGPITVGVNSTPRGLKAPRDDSDWCYFLRLDRANPHQHLGQYGDLHCLDSKMFEE